MVWFTRARTFTAIALLIWAAYRAHLPPLQEDLGWLAQPAGAADPIDGLESRFRALGPALPPTGVVGYLAPAANETYGGFYVAEYALTPRIIVPGTDAEFVIVPREALPADEAAETAVVGSASREPRLQGFLLYRGFDSGLRIFRRVR